MNRFRLASALVCALALVGLATLNGGLLALALPLALYLGLGLLYAPLPPDLHVERSIEPRRAAARQPFAVRVVVTNRGAHLENLLLQDLLPAGLEVLEGETGVLCELPSGGSLELAYTLRGGRGIYSFGGLQAQASDRLGLVERSAFIPGEGQIFVLPHVPVLRRVAIRPRRTRVYAGSIPARQGGPGVEFFGVREYQPGDSLGRINWRVSARYLESMYSNEFEQERVADVWLVLDARQRSVVLAEGRSLFEHSVTAAAALAQALLADGNRVGLLVYGGFLDWTYPGYGKLQGERILRSLSRSRPGDSLIFDKLENLPARFFPPHVQLILVSPLHSEDLGILLRLRARGHRLLALSPDPIQFESDALASQPDGPLGLRLARLERGLLLDGLRHAGVQVFSWDVSLPFDRAASLALGRAVQGR